MHLTDSDVNSGVTVCVLTVLCCVTDDSTSMKYADKGERIDDLRLILERIAEVRVLCSCCDNVHNEPQQTVLNVRGLLLMHIAAPEAVL